MGSIRYMARIITIIFLILLTSFMAYGTWGGGTWGDWGDLERPVGDIWLSADGTYVVWTNDNGTTYTVAVRASDAMTETYKGKWPIYSGEPNSVLMTPGDVNSQWIWAEVDANIIDINDPNISIKLPTLTPWNVTFVDSNGFPIYEDPNDFTYYQPERAFGIGMDSIAGRTYADNLIEVYSLLWFDPNTLSTSIGWGGDHSMAGPNNVRIGFGAGTSLRNGIENSLGGKDAGRALVDANDNTGWGYKVIGGQNTAGTGAYPLLRPTTDQADPGLPHTLAVTTLTDLENINDDLTGNYYLTGDIDASSTSDPGYVSYSSFWTDFLGDGWMPIGPDVDFLVGPFSGTFDGCGYTISGLYMDSSGGGKPHGLFGTLVGAAKIANVTVENVDMTVSDASGALVGEMNPTTGDMLIQNCHSSGTITARLVNDAAYGGLIGRATGTSDYTIEVFDCTSSVFVDNTPATTIGGLLGGLIARAHYSHISNCSATGNVAGSTNQSDNVGGLIGTLGKVNGGDDCRLEYSFATGNVTGTTNVGGLIGKYRGDLGSGYIRKCYATGSVTRVGGAPAPHFGGLIGTTQNNCEVTDCYAWGDVANASGGTDTGGFLGFSNSNDEVSQVYSIGLVTVTGASYGGLVGNVGALATPVFSDTYWDTDTSGQATSAEGVGHTTTWLQTKSNYPASWDFVSIWYMPGFYDVYRVAAFGAYAASNVGGGADDGLYLGTHSGEYNQTDPNRFFLDNLDRGDYPGNKQHGMMYGYFDVDPNDQWLHINAYLRALRYEVDNSATYIDSDGSGNMTFTDAVVGTKTLQELGSPTYKIIDVTGQAEGDLHLADASTWAISKAIITSIRVVTSSTDWDLWVIQNDNGFAADDANVPMFRRANTVSGNATLMMNVAYEDEDASSEVHLYYLDNSGANTADIYIIGYQMI